MDSREDIEKAIREAVGDVTGITGLDDDANLTDTALGIAPANFLYIFDILERRLQVPAHDVLKTSGYQVMGIKNLTDALYEL
jgi:hypothetical protein